MWIETIFLIEMSVSTLRLGNESEKVETKSLIPYIMKTAAIKSESTAGPILARDGQFLHVHLCAVASLARKFAEAMGLENLAYACGLLHDLGKYSKAFQTYLRNALDGKKVCRGEVLHAWEGALVVLQQLGENRATMGLADILANVLASHHGGLTDMIADSERVMPGRIEVHSRTHPEQVRDVMESTEVAGILAKIDWNAVQREFADLKKQTAKNSFSLHLAVKFLFSCLVDADRCNAAGMDNLDSSPDWDNMERCLEAKLAAYAGKPEESKSPLDKVRASISDQCAEQAARASGIFTLAVPTGGGKTLSSLRFAIRHARAKGLRRIIYVIPYLSIIDQTASELRKIFGNRADDWLLEHHSNFFLESENEDDENRYDLGTQRWDAPVIVTTMVQFLESVMSNKASDLRKFHNMMQSVFVFDEVQALPVKCTHLFNATVNFLHEFGGSSCVMCSATQPALANVEIPLCLSPSPDLVTLPDTDKVLFRRTILVDKTALELTCEEIAELALSRFCQGKSTLVVMNTKAEARKVFDGVGEAANRYFLSTDMCPAHRLDVIDRMRAALNPDYGGDNQPVLCVSTQLIEAGVDISFDCVIRAEAGCDSIIQAAGRCNRHGRASAPQEVIIVRVKDEKLGNLPEIELGRQITDRLLREHLLETPEQALATYYRYKFGDNKQKILVDYPTSKDFPKTGTTLFNALGKNTRSQMAFKDAHNGVSYSGLHSAFQFAAEHFSVIDGFHIGVVVPYVNPQAPDEVQSLVADFRATTERLRATFDREARTAIYRERSRIFRRLQRYTVSVYANQEESIRQMAELVDDTFYLLSPAHYDSVMGLTQQQGFLSI